LLGARFKDSEGQRRSEILQFLTVTIARSQTQGLQPRYQKRVESWGALFKPFFSLKKKTKKMDF
jgi:hypothetical protein